MGKDPSFPFYASDWLGSTKVIMMTPEERGGYIHLLAHQWGDKTCSLPDDEKVLSVLSGLNERWFDGCSAAVKRCFPKHPTLPNRVANQRLTDLKLERENRRKQCSEAGKKSQIVQAKQADNTRSTGVEQPLNSPSPSPSPSSLPLSSKKEASPSYRSDESDIATANWMFSLIQDMQPGRKKPNIYKWGDCIRRIREKDKKTDQQIRNLFTLANRDEFWRLNILSPDKLRQKWDDLELKLGGQNGQGTHRPGELRGSGGRVGPKPLGRV